MVNSPDQHGQDSPHNPGPGDQPVSDGDGPAADAHAVPGRWDVYRDKRGNPVTLTGEQLAAICHAVEVVEEVRRAEGYPSLWDGPGKRPWANLRKSRLLGRMLVDGRPPLETKPPGYLAACGYHLVEPSDWDHYYMGKISFGRIEGGRFVRDDAATWSGGFPSEDRSLDPGPPQ